MPRCSILTDSAAALDQETIERFGIKVLPVSVHLGSETFREGIDITPEQFLSRMAGAGRFPVMSPPTMAEFHHAYEELAETSAEILSLHAAAPLCPALDAARQAAGSFFGRCKIEVMDTETISRGEGILVRAAAEAALSGQSLEDIVRLLRGLIPHVYSIFFVESLDYLEHNGRIGVAQAILGTMLGVKPLLTIEDGDIIPMEKVRSREKAVEKLVEFIAEFSHIEELVLLEDRFTQDTADLLERLDLIFPGRPVPIFPYGPSLAVHLGAEAMGAVIFEGV